MTTIVPAARSPSRWNFRVRIMLARPSRKPNGSGPSDDPHQVAEHRLRPGDRHPAVGDHPDAEHPLAQRLAVEQPLAGRAVAPGQHEVGDQDQPDARRRTERRAPATRSPPRSPAGATTRRRSGRRRSGGTDRPADTRRRSARASPAGPGCRAADRHPRPPLRRSAPAVTLVFAAAVAIALASPTQVPLPQHRRQSYRRC